MAWRCIAGPPAHPKDEQSNSVSSWTGIDVRASAGNHQYVCMIPEGNMPTVSPGQVPSQVRQPTWRLLRLRRNA